MKTLARKYSYSLLPVLIRQIRQHTYCPITVGHLVREAHAELKTQEKDVLARRRRFMTRVTSRALVNHAAPCFECEERAILLALEAANSLEAFLQTGHPGCLCVAQANYAASEHQYDRLVRLRKQMPAGYHEALQKAA